ncbi:helix-turn-helix domain-containing protein [Runella zeae]|uniref:helix-turn-helix domain-containing protein n=1 Tax=Runella zeae TaxID=94255 RepID=UPI002354C7E6|nr:helix-turn-helix domain-containing protein [Runella zeae]
MNEVYDKIKAIRLAKGLTQIEVAEKTGMTQGNYGRLEKGLIQVTIERLEQLADVFGMSVGNILNYEGETPIEKADIDFLRNEVFSLQRQNVKLKKTIAEKDEIQEETESYDFKKRKELENKIKELKKEVQDLKEKIGLQKERLDEKDRTIKLLEKTIEALTRIDKV